MKLHAEIYPSPVDVEGTHNNVFIEDVSYEIKREENFFAVDFEMYTLKNDKRIILDKARLAFKGTDEESAQGKPTSNKTALLNVKNPEYNPNVLQYIDNPDYDPEAPETITIANPDYIAGDLMHNSITIEVPNPKRIQMIPNPNYIPEFSTVPLLKYLVEHQGQMPEEYEVKDWGYPTYTAVMQYFSGGTLDAPELFIESPFAREWLLNTMQMKGQHIKEHFEFV